VSTCLDGKELAMVAAAEHESAYKGKNPYDQGGTEAAYIMTNQDTGNAVTVLERAADGGLTEIETFPTGGLGNGNAANVANALDPLVSQGSPILSDDHRFLFAVNAGSNEVSVLAIEVVSGSVPTTEEAACWVVTNSITDPRYAYVVNATSGSISGYRIAGTGALSLLDPDGRTGVTVDSLAAIDSAVSGDGRFLYVLTGGFSATSQMPDLSAEMSITSFRIETDGSLTTIPGPGGFPPGTQGIAAI
jgi:6-phosphogluconolactonase (cycloisomerase 2 family)